MIFDWNSSVCKPARNYQALYHIRLIATRDFSAGKSPALSVKFAYEHSLQASVKIKEF